MVTNVVLNGMSSWRDDDTFWRQMFIFDLWENLFFQQLSRNFPQLFRKYSEL